jgi:hypothetical protein
MKPDRVVPAAAVLLAGVTLTAGGQSSGKPNSAAIPECQKYEAMINACLPKMCEEERALAEMELSFHRETLAKVVELKGRQEGAHACTRSIRDAIADDLYGCYAAEPGAPTHPIRLDQVRPAATSVSLTLTSAGIAANENARLVIAPSISEPPTAVYALPREKGTFVIDTSSTTSTGARGGAPGPPIPLEPRTTYCFVIESETGTARKVYRQGIFTTLPKR